MICAYWNVSIWTEKAEKAIKAHNQLDAIPKQVWGSQESPLGNILSLNRSLIRLGTYVSEVSCIKRGRIKRIFLDNLSFIVSTLTYITANVIDYLFTIRGIDGNPFREANPILREYIQLFGAVSGILICKLLICIGVISAMRVVHLAHREKRTRLRAEYILYGGAILTTLGGSLWLFY